MAVYCTVASLETLNILLIGQHVTQDVSQCDHICTKLHSGAFSSDHTVLSNMRIDFLVLILHVADYVCFPLWNKLYKSHCNKHYFHNTNILYCLVHNCSSQ